MASGGGSPSNAANVIFSIQRTYILNPVFKSEKTILTCDERIDIPTIESLTQRKASVSPDTALTVVPCIELAGAFLSKINLTFETNEGVTVLPVKIQPGNNQFENPYTDFRYVLVLPRGTTGVKSCKLIYKATGEEVQHNFTFGIMPPPYNYDNALFEVISTMVIKNSGVISAVVGMLEELMLTTLTPSFAPIELPKGAGKQTINIENGVLFYETLFNFSSSTEATIHNPKITLHGDDYDYVYTLSVDSTLTSVSIDLLACMITLYDGATGEILKQFKLDRPLDGFETLSFENFDDINDNVLYVHPMGARVV